MVSVIAAVALLSAPNHELASGSIDWVARRVPVFRISSDEALRLRVPELHAPYLRRWSPIRSWITRDGHVFSILGGTTGPAACFATIGRACRDGVQAGVGVSWRPPRSPVALFGAVTLDSTAIGDGNTSRMKAGTTVVVGVRGDLPSVGRSSAAQ